MRRARTRESNHQGTRNYPRHRRTRGITRGFTAVKIRNLRGVGINVVDIERFVDAMLVRTLVQIVCPVRVQMFLGSGKPRLR